jgi:hypothetical protein
MEGSSSLKSAVNLKRFSRLRQDVFGALSRIAELTQVLGSAKVAEQPNEVFRQLDEECLRLVGIGEFFHGCEFSAFGRLTMPTRFPMLTRLMRVASHNRMYF